MLEEAGEAGREGSIVEGLAAVLEVCQALHDERLALGLTVAQVAVESGGEAWAAEWVDEGDVSAPVEALVYYAAAVGLKLEIGVRSPAS